LAAQKREIEKHLNAKKDDGFNPLDNARAEIQMSLNEEQAELIKSIVDETNERLNAKGEISKEVRAEIERNIN